MTLHCPICQQPLPQKPGRICGRCKRPIRRHDRWHMVNSQVQHRDCKDPELGSQPAQPQNLLLEDTAR